MANYLLLNKPQVWNGLGTLTYVVPTGTATQLYTVVGSVTVPQAVREGDGAGSGTGLGSGAGGGDALGFSVGGVHADTGGVGRGFGAVANDYPQPPQYGSNETSFAAVTSGLSVVVNLNGSPVYTMPTLGVSQSASQFQTAVIQAVATDTITVVLSSAVASDAALNGLTSTIAIQQGR